MFGKAEETKNLWRALHGRAFKEKRQLATNSLNTFQGGEVQRHLRHCLLQL